MPFINQILEFINQELKNGSLNKEKLQPAKFHGLSTVITRSNKGKTPDKLETLPAMIDEAGKVELITLDSKLALQVYHKLLGKAYSYEKKSYGDSYLTRCVSDMTMIVITNCELTKSAKEVLEPVILFGLPQRLSVALIADLKLNSCLITPVSSNMNHPEIYRQEYPKADYALNENLSMFSIRYKIETTFSQACIDACLCN